MSQLQQGVVVEDNRHPGIKEIVQWFDYGHLPDGAVRNTSRECMVLAQHMVDSLDDGAELTAGLRKLLEAKDCFVRQAIKDQRAGARRQYGRLQPS